MGAPVTAVLWVGIALCGGAGAVARFLVDRVVSRRLPGDFPSGIFVVNVSGALLLGLLGGLAVNATAARLIGVAFLGGYTTFSTWMLQTALLAEERRAWPAVANIVGSLVAGVAAAALGWWTGTLIR